MPPVSGHSLHRLPVMLELEGGRYEMVMMSDIDDAMTLELWEAKPEDDSLATGGTVLRIVRFNATGRYDFTAYRENLPVPLVEHFIAAAKQALPPKPQAV